MKSDKVSSNFYFKTKRKSDLWFEPFTIFSTDLSSDAR
jgi:hypothetical protein